MCKCSWFRAKHIDKRCTNLTNFEKVCLIESWFFSYEEKYTYCLSKIAETVLCHRTTFYSIFNMSSCRKPEIHSDLPKITKIKWFFLLKSGKKSLTMFISSYFNNCWIDFLKIWKLKNKTLRLQWDSNPQSLRFEATEHLRNRMLKEKAFIWDWHIVHPGYLYALNC